MQVEVDVVPQGTLAEQIRAAGAGIGGFYTPTGVSTVVEQGKERRIIGGRDYLLELPLRADFAFIRAQRADRLGNLVYKMAARNFNPAMATAAHITSLAREMGIKTVLVPKLASGLVTFKMRQ